MAKGMAALDILALSSSDTIFLAITIAIKGTIYYLDMEQVFHLSSSIQIPPLPNSPAYSVVQEPGQEPRQAPVPLLQPFPGLLAASQSVIWGEENNKTKRKKGFVSYHGEEQIHTSFRIANSAFVPSVMVMPLLYLTFSCDRSWKVLR